ncbi:MAG: succinylglutamate desuccinylase/aspartoacylase family protein [Clostridia bacterium]|nr:succinylglutamate desuccinylase/aspartoacylase family protein [Clostridia bacterium]
MEQDAIFQEKNVFTPDLWAPGLRVDRTGDETGAVTRVGGGVGGAFVLPLRFGSVYVARFEQKPPVMRGAVTAEDPRALVPGGALSFTPAKSVPCPVEDEGARDFLYTPTAPGQFLTVFTGDAAPFVLWEYPVLLGRDTDDDWYRPGPQPDLLGGEGSWADWDWTSDQVIEKLYEPMRAAHPDYITRSVIGRDDTDSYDIWSYVFRPEGYEQTILVTGGLHALEMDGYLSLARLMYLMVNEDGTHAGLHYLRTKVKIVLVPILNVYSASNGHARRNGRDVDLNRDFGDQSQAETRAVTALFRKYKDEAASLIDYHTSKLTGVDLYYQFSIDAPNSALCRRVTNHIYEDLKARGLLSDPVDITRIPGALDKDDKYLQGFVWNHLGIPTLVVEHEHLNYAPVHSAFNVELAVEYYGNFLIQTALAKLKLLK